MPLPSYVACILLTHRMPNGSLFYSFICFKIHLRADLDFTAWCRATSRGSKSTIVMQGHSFQPFSVGPKNFDELFLVIFTKIRKHFYISEKISAEKVNSYLSIKTCTQMCLLFQSHHFGKCSRVVFEHFFTLTSLSLNSF